MSDEALQPKVLPDLQQIRKREEDFFSRIYEDEPYKIAFNVDWNVFCAAEPQQVTQEMVTQMLTSSEAYWREGVNRRFAENPNVAYTEYWFDLWSKTQDAMNGAKGKGSISKTVDYLREHAAQWQHMADENHKILEEGGPYRENPLTEAATKERQIGIWNHITANLNTAARLFENAPIIEVTPELSTT